LSGAAALVELVMRVLAIDPGAQRVGLARSEEGGVVLPLRTLERAGHTLVETAAQIAVEAAAVGAEEIVVGLPIQLDGVEGPSAKQARALGDAVARASGRTVVYWDERWTTTLAERNLRHLKGGARAKRQVVDQAAAVLLLESYLEAGAQRTWNDAQVAQVVGAQAAEGAARKRAKRGGRGGSRRR
jgi:putative holliday junction resolvase